MRLLGISAAVLVLVALVTAAGCGSSNMTPTSGGGKMDGNMMSDGKIAIDGIMMGWKISGDK